MLPAKLRLAFFWVVLAVVNLGVYLHNGFWLTALLSAVTAGVGGAMLVGILRDLL